MNTPPTTLIIFGATGDLMGKKIVPALWHLYRTDQLPLGWSVIGVSRRDLAQKEFRGFTKDLLLAHVPEEFRTVDEEKFLEMFSFQKVSFESDTDFDALAQELDARDRARGVANRLLYMAVPPDAFPGIFGHAGFGSIVNSDTRVIIEKPFGTDEKTAEELEEVLAKRFTEDQLYRADHYLTKAVLKFIPHFRFGAEHGAFESMWNNEHIDSIHIRTIETLGLEKRGAFYDPLGTIRDVGQNHLLEMLALVTMERPGERSAASARQGRAEAISKLRIPNEEAIKKHTFRAQYEGYREIAGVKPDSETETYYRLTAFVDSPRWQGVPIVMEAGKRMGEWRTEIIVSFKKPLGTLAFRMRPTEEIVVALEGKTPYTVDFPHAETTQQYVAEYSQILMEGAKGDQTLFVGKDEIKSAWRFIDPIVAGWKKNLTPLAFYKTDTLPSV